MKPHISNSFKVSIIGAGRVGTTAAFTMLLDGTPTEIVLYGRDKQKMLGEKLDLEHALPFLDYVNIVATDSFDDIAGSHLIVYTAGAAQAPGETRLDLFKKNLDILEKVLPEVNQVAPDALIAIIANPVDVLTYHAHQIIPSASKRIFGSGTMLDTARFRFHLAEKMKVNPQSVHAYILGEHGDSSFPVYAFGTVGGQRILDFPNIDKQNIFDAFEKARKAAYNIIKAKGSTYYAIGVVAKKIMETIFSDAKTVLPLSVPLHDYHGHSGVSLSVPCVLGADGIEKVLNIELSPEEQRGLAHSVKTLKQFC